MVVYYQIGSEYILGPSPNSVLLTVQSPRSNLLYIPANFKLLRDVGDAKFIILGTQYYNIV